MKESLYDTANSRLNSIKNTGFDYEGKLFEKSLSPYILADPKRSDILKNYEKLIYFVIQKIKYIKTFYNYTVDKNYKHLD